MSKNNKLYYILGEVIFHLENSVNTDIQSKNPSKLSIKVVETAYQKINAALSRESKPFVSALHSEKLNIVESFQSLMKLMIGLNGIHSEYNVKSNNFCSMSYEHKDYSDLQSTVETLSSEKEEVAVKLINLHSDVLSEAKLLHANLDNDSAPVTVLDSEANDISNKPKSSDGHFGLLTIRGELHVGKGEISYLLPLVNNETFALSNVVIKLNSIIELDTLNLTIGVNCKEITFDLTKHDVDEKIILQELMSAIGNTEHENLTALELKTAVNDVTHVLSLISQ